MKKCRRLQRIGTALLSFLLALVSFSSNVVMAKGIDFPDGFHVVSRESLLPCQLHFDVNGNGVIEPNSERTVLHELYAMPLDVTSYPSDESILREENAVYCIDNRSVTYPIQKMTESQEPVLKYVEAPEVQEKAEERYGLDEGAWQRATALVAYHERIGEERDYNPCIIWTALYETVESKFVQLAKTSMDDFTQLSKKNEKAHNDSQEYNQILDEFSEMSLCALRDGVKPTKAQSSLVVDHPGKYQFPKILGYAVPGIRAKSKAEAIELDSSAKNPLPREALLQEDSGYALSFTLSEQAKPGTYEIEVIRPKTMQEAEWHFYACEGDETKQWLASYTTQPEWVTDTFVITYEPKVEEPESQSESEPESKSEQPPESKPQKKPESYSTTILNSVASSCGESASPCAPIAIAIATSPNRNEVSNRADEHDLTHPAEENTEQNVTNLPKEATERTEEQEKGNQNIKQPEKNDLPFSDSSEEAEVNPQNEEKGHQDHSSAEGKVSVKEKAPQSPKTGDSIRLLLWATVGITAALALLWSLHYSAGHRRGRK